MAHTYPNETHSDAFSSINRRSAFVTLRVVFGLIWVFNAVYQMNPQYIDGLFLKSIAAHSGQAAWYVAYTNWAMHTISSVGAAGVAMVTVAIAVLLALSLLTGVALRPMAWFGAVFTLFMWTLTGHLGGPYGAGATDPGTLIVYSLTFIAILLAEPASQQADSPASQARRYRTLSLLFGALWAFDAAWKWTPYFLHHALSYLTQAQAGQPAWIVAYIQFFIDGIQAIGPFTFAIIAALAETLIAVGLLTNRGLRFILPFGFIYSIGLWTTAEGWGGPYGAMTGVGGDVLGTTIIYALLFAYLMVMYPVWRKH